LVHATYPGYIYSSEGNAIYDVRGLQEGGSRKCRAANARACARGKGRGH
jgi:hypothetical protein